MRIGVIDILFCDELDDLRPKAQKISADLGLRLKETKGSLYWKRLFNRRLMVQKIAFGNYFYMWYGWKLSFKAGGRSEMEITQGS